MGISGDGTINHMRRLPIFDARLSVGFAKNFIDSRFFPWLSLVEMQSAFLQALEHESAAN